MRTVLWDLNVQILHFMHTYRSVQLIFSGFVTLVIIVFVSLLLAVAVPRLLMFLLSDCFC